MIRVSRRWMAFSLLIGLRSAASLAQNSAAVDEVGLHVTTLKQQAEDPSRPVGQRESLLMNAAEALDRAAHRATSLDEKQARWTRAIELLDEFQARNPGHPRFREFQLQAAVYRWAQGQSWRDAASLSPSDGRLREQAAVALDDTLARLRAVPQSGLDLPVAENLRFRLARALADRAELDAADPAEQRAHEAEALEIIREPMSAPGLKGFAGLLRADLLRRTGRLDEALKEVAAAAKAQPAPPEREIYEVLVPILIDQGRFQEADAAVQGSRQEPPAKDLQRFQIALARALQTAPGDERLDRQRELFRLADALHKRNSAELRRALVILGERPLELDPRLDPVAWETLGAALEVRGKTQEAAEMLQRAARRAAELGRSEEAAGHRLRGGGFLFRAGKYMEADALLSQVIADPGAGAFRPRAGMLRALARGRALAAGTPGVTPESYARSLQDQIRDFPADPATGEARWLLGSLLHASGETKKAMDLWEAIPRDAPRWLDARVARFNAQIQSLTAELFISERPALVSRYQKLQAEIAADRGRAVSDHERVELGMTEARLNLLPLVGNPAQALDDCNRLEGRGASPLQRYRLRLLRIIALIHLGPPFLEAEREAQGHATWMEPAGRATLLDAIRLLDLCAAFSDADLRQRRFGLVLRLLIQPALLDSEESSWTPAQRSELRLRLARACLFLGDERGARAALRGWNGPPGRVSDDFLRDIADTYSRLEAHELAIDVQRMRSRQVSAGSPAWFEARYSLALAYFHAGRLDEAAQLIDATAILHPDLGGGAVQKKLIRLRQRLGKRP